MTVDWLRGWLQARLLGRGECVKGYEFVVECVTECVVECEIECEIGCEMGCEIRCEAHDLGRGECEAGA